MAKVGDVQYCLRYRKHLDNTPDFRYDTVEDLYNSQLLRQHMRRNVPDFEDFKRRIEAGEELKYGRIISYITVTIGLLDEDE